ncbi:MAG: hypothetical protein ACRECW_04895 [Phyllobacterium sp.]
MKSAKVDISIEKGELAMIQRIERLVDELELDCECRARLDGALNRFTELHWQRMARQHLICARQHRERIGAILSFLQELDELGAREPDRTVYVELALLFDEIAVIAQEGAASMNQLAAQLATGTTAPPSEN